MAEAIYGGDILVELRNNINIVEPTAMSKIVQPSKVNNNSEIENTEEVNVLDRVPANIEEAKNHALAKRVAKPIGSNKICECCGFQIENETMSIFCDTVDLSFLGPGLPLYFGFIKASILFLILLSIVYTTYGLYSNRKGKFCVVLPNGVSLPDGLCSKNIFNENSLVNKVGDEDQIKIQNIVNLGLVILLIVALHIYRRQMRQQAEALDFNLTSPSDFTAQLYNLPPKYNAEDVKRLLSNWWNNQSEQTKQEVGLFQVEKVCIAYDVKEYVLKINLRNSLNLQIRKINAFKSKAKNKDLVPPGLSKEELLTKRKEVQKDIDALEAEVFDGKYQKVTKHCFVTFNTRKVLECLIDSQNLSLFQRFMVKLRKCFGSELPEILSMTHDGSDYIIRVRRAPEPSDVKWENCGATTTEKVGKRLFTWLITIILLGACFILIYLINKWQYNVNEDNKNKQDDSIVKAQLILLSLFSSFSIVFINNCLNIAIRLLSNVELQSTVTSLNSSIAQKLTIAQFCNSALITLAVNYTIDSNSFWGNGGITNDFTLIALTNCILPPILNFFNPFALLRIIMRRKIRVNNDSGQYSQGEANSWYEGGPLELSIKYASCIKTLWMIGFYTPLSPYLPVIGFVSLMLNYCMDKYLLLYRLARPNLIGSDLNLEMIELAEYFPFSVAIGNLVWMNKLEYAKGTNLILILIAVGISAFNFVIPSDKINKMLFKIKELDDNQRLGTYQDNKYNFDVEYDRCNPITKEEAIKSYFKELQVKDKDKAKDYMNKQQINNGVQKNWFQQQQTIPIVSNIANSFFPANQPNKDTFQDNHYNIPQGQQQQQQPQNAAPPLYQPQAGIPSFYQAPPPQHNQIPPTFNNNNAPNANLFNPLLDARNANNNQFFGAGAAPAIPPPLSQNIPMFQNGGQGQQQFWGQNPFQQQNNQGPFQNGMMNQGVGYQNPQNNQFYNNYQSRPIQ